MYNGIAENEPGMFKPLRTTPNYQTKEFGLNSIGNQKWPHDLQRQDSCSQLAIEMVTVLYSECPSVTCKIVKAPL